ncbi:MAG TPA: hypothetical protein VFZ58_03440 [Candidatus Saccharimonadales bacterium]
MSEITVSVNLRFLHEGSGTEKAVETFLNQLAVMAAAEGVAIDVRRNPVRSQELLELGIPPLEMRSLTKAGVVSKDELLGCSEEDLLQKEVSHDILFIVRRALHQRQLYLQGDSAERHENELISYLDDSNRHTYSRLRKMKIVSFQQFTHALLAFKPHEEVVAVSNIVQKNYEHRLKDRP